MAQKFLSDIHPTAGLKDSSGDLGASGQVLSSTGSGTNWVQAGSGATVIHDDQFTATANQTAFTLSNTVDAENKTQVYIDGAYQAKAGYTVSGTTLTFDTGLDVGSKVEVITFATAIASNATAVIKLDEFVPGDAISGTSGQNFTLSQTVSDEKVTQVYINGVYQHKDTYSISGTTLQFSSAPPSGSDIEVITFDTVVAADGTLSATTFLGDLNGTINTATTATTQSAGNNSTKISTTAYTDAKVADAINNGTTAIAPSQNAVFDALALKANLAGPTFTGTPAAPTASAGTNTTQLATTAFVTTGISNIVDSSPAALNTLNELAAALGDDANFSTTVTNSIATKLPLAGGTLTGKLSVSQSGADMIDLTRSSVGTYRLAISGSDAFSVFDVGANADRFVISSSGNVGIGLSPSTVWSTSYNALQIGLGGSIYAHKSAGSAMRIAANVVYEGTAPNYYDKYLTTSTASKYEQDSGNHIWSTAASGTINTNISWSERLRVSSDGNVGIGISSPRAILDLKNTGDGVLNTTASNYQILLEAPQGTGDYGRNIGWAIGSGSVNAAINAVDGGASNATDLSFSTGAENTMAERLRIKSNGNVGIGTDSPEELLDVYTEGADPTSILQIRANRTGYGSIRTNLKTYSGGSSATNKFTINFEGTDALTISSGGDATFSGKISSVKELININSANGLRSLGLESDSSGNVWIGTGTTAATINLVTGNSTNGLPSVNGVKRLSTNSLGTTIYATFASNTFPFRVNTSPGDTNIFKIADTGATAIRMNPTSTLASLTLEKLSNSVAINDTIGYLNFFSNDASTTSTGGVGGIAVKAHQSFNSGYTPSYMSFYTHAISANDGTNIGNVTERMRISSGGTVQIYGTASANSLNIDHDSGNNVTMGIPFLNTSQDFVIRNSSAGVNLDYAATSWVSASDENIKENITSLDNVLDKIKNIRCVNYNLKDEEIYKKRLGFIAQDFQNDFEEVTSRDNDDILGLRYTETIPILMKAIQEQQTIIEDLKSRIETLEG